MNKKELQNLRIGDVVVISAKNSKNNGKRGTVIDIVRQYDKGNITVRPLDCVFVMATRGYQKIAEDGNLWWSHYALQLDGKEIKEKILPKSKLQIYRFVVDIGWDEQHWNSVVCTNKDDALKMIHADMLTYACEEDICITFKDIVPFTYGTII